MLYQIALTLIPGIGNVMSKRLIEKYGSAENIFKEKKKLLTKIPRINKEIAEHISLSSTLQRAEEELNFASKNNIQIISFFNKCYPNRLKHCIDSPIILYFKGNADFNNSKVISVVGTRKATEYGNAITNKIISGLQQENVLIVSGLAYGIDTCAHKAALTNGLSTVGVLAHGLDRIYPSQNKMLATKMLDNGGLITDYISKTRPDAPNFPSRNRIVAGMADAVVVIEAAKGGGALITAEIANSYNRDVFAVPGRLSDTYSAGCNHLIKINKAALIESAEDISYLLGWQKKEKEKHIQKSLFIELSPSEKKVYDIIFKIPDIDIDALCFQCKEPLSFVSTALLSLEMQGVVQGLPGKRYKVI